MSLEHDTIRLGDFFEMAMRDLEGVAGAGGPSSASASGSIKMRVSKAVLEIPVVMRVAAGADGGVRVRLPDGFRGRQRGRIGQVRLTLAATTGMTDEEVRG